MNEIVIYPNGARQITGDLAHKFAFSENWREFYRDILGSNQFFVVEPHAEGYALKAGQSTVRGAHSYLNPDRVLIYFHNPKDETHLNALQVRLSHERARCFEEKNSQAMRQREVWCKQIEKEIAAERAFLGLPDESPLPEMSDAELLANLNA